MPKYSALPTATSLGPTDVIAVLQGGLSKGAAPGLFLLPWTEVTGTSQTAAVDNGYILNNVALVTITLPTTFAVGDVVVVIGKGAGGWKVGQPAGDNIQFGDLATTAGTGGSLQSTNQYDCVELIGIVANTTWAVHNSQGNITVV